MKLTLKGPLVAAVSFARLLINDRYPKSNETKVHSRANRAVALIGLSGMCLLSS